VLLRPIILDICCGAGGAGKGYDNVGFEVIGVDLHPQPNYPFQFIQADALDVLARLAKGWPIMCAGDWLAAEEIVAFHASFPCQRWTAYGRRNGVDNSVKPDLITPGRELLRKIGKPYVLENVPGAPLEDPVRICGTSFDQLDVKRHRMFEANFPLVGTGCDHNRRTPRYPGATNRSANSRRTVEVGVYRIPLETQKRAMGVDWDVTLGELSEAIPPAYTEHVGRQLLAHLAPGRLNFAALG
jgi:DNA (cytosine-5)-methyltransferase 1